jgi:antitoxin HicB
MQPIDIEAYLNLPYTTEVVREEDKGGNGFYVARHPELEGCMAQGQTPEEALASLREATELYIRGLLKRGIDIPLPQRAEPDSRRAESQVAMET